MHERPRKRTRPKLEESRTLVESNSPPPKSARSVIGRDEGELRNAGVRLQRPVTSDPQPTPKSKSLGGSRGSTGSGEPPASQHGVGVIAFAGYADLELGCGFGRHKAVHGLHQLSVRLVRNCNYIQQHLILIQFALVNMERTECADLKYPRFLN